MHERAADIADEDARRMPAVRLFEPGRRPGTGQGMGAGSIDAIEPVMLANLLIVFVELTT